MFPLRKKYVHRNKHKPLNITSYSLQLFAFIFIFASAFIIYLGYVRQLQLMIHAIILINKIECGIINVFNVPNHTITLRLFLTTVHAATEH